MKDKRILLIVAGVIAVLVIAYVLFMRPGATNPLMNGTPTDVIESAFNGNGSAICEYTDAGGVATTVYVKNGMVRTNMTGGSENVMTSMIMSNGTIWTWDGNTMQGMMMQIPEVTPEAIEEEVDAETEYNPDQVKADLETYKDSCQATNVDDTLFVPPTNVTFQDMSSMMEGMQGAPNIPAGYEQYMPR